jgi:CelD/BcsL family acetyltransferase involved in cellulose biosynthesis
MVSYAPQFGRYSPGLILYWNMAEAAAGIGITRIDMGGGDYAYKRMLANAATRVASGAVDRIAVVAAAQRWQEWSASRIRGSRLLRPPARAVLRAYRRLRPGPSA